MDPRALPGGKHGMLLQELIAITTATSIDGESDPYEIRVSAYVQVS